MCMLLHPDCLVLVSQGPERLPVYHCCPDEDALRPSEQLTSCGKRTSDRMCGPQRRKM